MPSNDKSLSPIQQSIQPTEVGTNNLSKPFYTWLNKIYSLLGFKNCRNVQFVPDISGVSGNQITEVGYYNIFRNLLHFSITLESETDITLVDAVLNVKDFNVPVTPLIHGSCNTFDVNGTLVETTLVEGGLVNLPDIISTKVMINGFYQIEEIN